MSKVVVPGSFDPVTAGHLDIITRACRQFDEVVVAVVINPNKQGLFTIDERLELLEAVTTSLSNVTVDTWQGLLVDYTTDNDITGIVKGLRSANDFDYELPFAHMNGHLTGVDTLFLATDPSLGFISSSLVKEVAKLGGDISGLVPDPVVSALGKKFS